MLLQLCTERQREKKQREETEGEKRDIFSAGKSNVLVTVVIADTKQISSEGMLGKCFQFYELITAA